MLLEERVVIPTLGFFLKSLWRVAVLIAVFEHVLCQSQQCASSANCIHLVPKTESSGRSLESLWLEIRCYLGCVDQVSSKILLQSCLCLS